GLDILSGTGSIKGALLGKNQAGHGPDCRGSVKSLGHNLVHHTAGCTFTMKSSDIVGKDPKLGSLKDNGGPTPTVAPSASSPAVDAIGKAACPVSTDQRGVHRPQGPRCDIGAVELKF